MAAERLHINSKVTKAGISRETIDGREHFKVTSRTLPFGITMNKGLYPATEIEANFKKLENTYAPLGHPEINGEYISAYDPRAVVNNFAGAWNTNPRIEGNRVTVDKMIDIEFAKNTPNGKKLVERLEALEKGEGEPISTSVAVFLKRMEANDAQKKQGIDWIAKIDSIDHDAILLTEPPAASPEQGVGMMVNCEEAVELKPNASAFVGESYREKESRIREAARARFNVEGKYIYVEDFTDEQAIIYREDVGAEVYGYKSEAGKIILDDQGQAVESKQSWVTKIPFVNHLLQTLGMDVKSQQIKPVVNDKEGEMPITAEEKAELIDGFGAKVEALLAPLKAEVAGVVANQKSLEDNLTANSRKEEDDMRVAVDAAYGEGTAKELTGNALRNIFQKLGTAAPIVNGKNGDKDKQDFSVVPE